MQYLSELDKKQKIENWLIRLILFAVFEIASFVIFILCLNSTIVIDSYQLLYFLPLSFFICNLLCYFPITKGSLLEKLPIYIVIVLLFIRNVITPAVMLNDSFVSSLGIPDKSDGVHAIWLIIYETVAVFLLLYVRNRIKIKSMDSKIHMKIIQPNKFVFTILFWTCLVICVLALILVKEFRTQYYSIFTKDITHITSETINYTSGTFMRVLATGGEILIGAMRLILPSTLMCLLAKKESFGRLMVCLILVFLQCMFMNDSNAYILMLMLSQLLFVCYLFPKYKKIVFRCAGVILIGFLILLYNNRFALDHYGSSFSLLLQSYVPSIANTAGIFNCGDPYKINQIFVDIFDAIPFKNYIFGTTDVDSIARIWNSVNGTKGQIVSTIGQGYYYFGDLLSPLLSCLIINISLKTYEKVKKTDNAILLSIYIYFAIYAAATPFVYNGLIFLKCFLQRVIFMFIIAKFAPFSIKKIRKKVN